MLVLTLVLAAHYPTSCYYVCNAVTWPYCWHEPWMAVSPGHHWTCFIKSDTVWYISFIASWYSWSKENQPYVFQSMRLKTALALQGVPARSSAGDFYSRPNLQMWYHFYNPSLSFWDTWGSGTRGSERRDGPTCSVDSFSSCLCWWELLAHSNTK